MRRFLNFNIRSGFLAALVLLAVLAVETFTVSCSSHIPEKNLRVLANGKAVFPDYDQENLFIPVNIAPLNFCILKKEAKTVSLVGVGDSIVVKVKNGQVVFPIKEWKSILLGAKGGFVRVKALDKDKKIVWHTVWHIAPEPIDPYLVYRINAYDENPCRLLQTFERSVEDFNSSVLMDNSLIDGGCFNCHSSAKNDGACLSVHLRGNIDGTLIRRNGEFVKIKIPDGFPDLRLTYPAWHPSKRFIAYSTNRINVFHASNKNKNQDLITDTLGLIVVYDIDNNRLLPTLSGEASFPIWSKDGLRLYFCRVNKSMYKDSLSGLKAISDFRYGLYYMAFDTLNLSFSKPVPVCIDSSYSLSLPALDESGRFMVVCLLPLGSFPSQNSGELALIDLEENKGGGLCSYKIIKELAGADGEKSHTFSSNGRWMVFGSKRVNGSMAFPFVCYFNNKGEFCSPFILPQKEGDFYAKTIKSFLFPVLNKNKVDFNKDEWAQACRKDPVFINMDKFSLLYKRGEKTSSALSGH